MSWAAWLIFLLVGFLAYIFLVDRQLFVTKEGYANYFVYGPGLRRWRRWPGPGPRYYWGGGMPWYGTWNSPCPGPWCPYSY